MAGGDDAAAIAVNSEPPASRSISIGSVTPAMRRTAAAPRRACGRGRRRRRLCRARPTSPARRRQCGGEGRRRRRVADAHLAEHEQVGVEPVDRGDGEVDDLVEALRFIAASKRMSAVGRPMPTSTVSRVAPTGRANAQIVERPWR